MTPEQEFSRVVNALEPYLADVVFIGGWAHRLFGLHPRASPVPFPLLTTLDADIAASPRLPVRGEPIPVLLKRAGFEEQLSGDEMPPFSAYQVPREGTLYVEFLVPQEGADTKRGGRRDVTTHVAGASAQKLRHLELLLHDPWRVELGPRHGFSLDPPREIRVPNATMYLLQKVLVLRARKKKQANDVLYIHDTLMLFRDSLGDFAPAARTALDVLSKKAQSAMRKNRKEVLEAVSEESEAAVRIARKVGRTEPASAAALAETCRAGLTRLFGE